MRQIDNMTPREIEILELKGMLGSKQRDAQHEEDLRQESRETEDREASGYWDERETGYNQSQFGRPGQ